jgi:putative transposase
MDPKNIQLDSQQFIEGLRAGKPLSGNNGLLTPLIKQLLEAAMMGELEQHLDRDTEPNRKNGFTSKTVKSSLGAFELDTPRDRNGSFEPLAVKKHQTQLTDEIENKILALYTHGTSYSAIQDCILELYGLELSSGTISAITDKLIPELKQWQERELESIYPIVWLDAIFYKIKENGRYVTKALYTLLGLTLEGKKDLLGIHLSDTEGAHYWLSVLTSLHNRGVKDILIACVDGLKGFPDAIGSIFPHAEVQLCIVHQIRNSLKYVASKNQKEFIADLKNVYRAPTKNAAEMALDDLENKWGSRYPVVIKSWRDKWENLSVYFKYPDEIRKIIYTTNAVEAVHRQFRKLTKTKSGFPNENSLLKLLYAGSLYLAKGWTRPVQNWNLALSQFSIHFSGRIDKYLEI